MQEGAADFTLTFRALADAVEGDEAAAITGANLSIDGGWTAQ